MLSEAQKASAILAWEEATPKLHKGKYINDYFTCGNCGTTILIHDNFCGNCGRRILWDNPRCLTGGNE